MPIRHVGQKGIHGYRECFTATGHVTIQFLNVPSEINAEDPAIRMILEKTAHAVRVILRIDAPRSGTSSFRKDHEDLLPRQEIVAFGKGRLHLFPVASPADGNAFRQITQDDQENIPLEICPFRKIPGEPAVFRDVPSHGHEGIDQDQGIDQGKMIAADQPRPPVTLHKPGPLAADLVQVPDPVAPPASQEQKI